MQTGFHTSDSIQNNNVRYIIRSKDRLNNTASSTSINASTAYTQNSPADFTVAFSSQIDQNVGEFWVKVINVSIPTIPPGISRGMVASANYALDTNSFVDIVASFQQSQCLDTDLGIAEKQKSDQTIATFAYDSRVATVVTNFNQSQSQWIRCKNTQMGTLQIKAFSDTGMQLGTRLLTGNTSTAITVYNVDSTSTYLNATGGFYQQLVILFTANVTTVTRGDQVTGGTLLNFISGDISVLSISGKNVTIGFPRQNLPQIATSTLTVYFSQNLKLLYPIKDWAMELLITSTNPVKSRLV
jgi:hypothetical protein